MRSPASASPKSPPAGAGARPVEDGGACRWTAAKTLAGAPAPTRNTGHAGPRELVAGRRAPRSARRSPPAGLVHEPRERARRKSRRPAGAGCRSTVPPSGAARCRGAPFQRISPRLTLPAPSAGRTPSPRRDRAPCGGARADRAPRPAGRGAAPATPAGSSVARDGLEQREARAGQRARPRLRAPARAGEDVQAARRGVEQRAGRDLGPLEQGRERRGRVRAPVNVSRAPSRSSRSASACHSAAAESSSSRASGSPSRRVTAATCRSTPGSSSSKPTITVKGSVGEATGSVPASAWPTAVSTAGSSGGSAAQRAASPSARAPTPKSSATRRAGAGASLRLASSSTASPPREPHSNRWMA